MNPIDRVEARNAAVPPDESCRIDDTVSAAKVIAVATLDLMGAGR